MAHYEFVAATDTFQFVELHQIFIDLSQALTDLFRYTGTRSGRQRSSENYDVCRRCATEWEDARMRITKVLDSLQMIQDTSNAAQDVYDALLNRYNEARNLSEKLEAELSVANENLDVVRNQLVATTDKSKTSVISSAWKSLQVASLGGARVRQLTDDSGHNGPRGFLTFVAGDVANAAVLWEQRPQAMTAAVQTLRETVVSLAAQHNGFATKPEDGGDAFLVAFHDTVAAVNFASALQLQLLTVSWQPDLLQLPVAAVAYDSSESGGGLVWRGLRVRLGAYSGIPTCVVGASGASGYRGLPVTAALGLLAIAAGGETVLGADVFHRLRAAGALNGLVVRCRGMRGLKGVASKQLVYSVLPEALAGRAVGGSGIYDTDPDATLAEAMKLDLWFMSVKGTPEATEVADLKRRARDADAAKAQVAQLSATVEMLEDRATRAEKEAAALSQHVKVLVEESLRGGGGGRKVTDYSPSSPTAAVATSHGAGGASPGGVEAKSLTRQSSAVFSFTKKKPRNTRRKTITKLDTDDGADSDKERAHLGTAAAQPGGGSGALATTEDSYTRSALRRFPLALDAMRSDVLQILLQDGEGDVAPPPGIAAGAAAVLYLHRAMRRALLSAHGIMTWATTTSSGGPGGGWGGGGDDPHAAPLQGRDPLLHWLPPGSSVMPEVVSMGLDGSGGGGHDVWSSLRHLAEKETLVTKHDEMSAFTQTRWSVLSTSGIAALAQLMIIFRHVVCVLLRELLAEKDAAAAAIAALKQYKAGGGGARDGGSSMLRRGSTRRSSRRLRGKDDSDDSDDAWDGGGTAPSSAGGNAVNSASVYGGVLTRGATMSKLNRNGKSAIGAAGMGLAQSSKSSVGAAAAKPDPDAGRSTPRASAPARSGGRGVGPSSPAAASSRTGTARSNPGRAMKVAVVNVDQGGNGGGLPPLVGGASHSD